MHMCAHTHIQCVSDAGYVDKRVGYVDKYLDGFPYNVTIVETSGEASYTSISFELVDKAIYYLIGQSTNKYMNE